MGFTPREYMALAGRPRSPAYMTGRGYSGSWTQNPSVLNNDYYTVLLNNDWEKELSGPPTVLGEFITSASGVYMVGEDIGLKSDYMFRSEAIDFSEFNDSWKSEF